MKTSTHRLSDATASASRVRTEQQRWANGGDADVRPPPQANSSLPAAQQVACKRPRADIDAQQESASRDKLLEMSTLRSLVKQGDSRLMLRVLTQVALRDRELEKLCARVRILERENMLLRRGAVMAMERLKSVDGA